MHLVCQNKTGSILYLSYDGETWRKSVLLESKTPNPYPKYFSLVPISGYVNLFYVISYKEKHMLIHQLFHSQDKPPVVVDHIQICTPPFIVTKHTGTDLLLLYENETGTSGFRRYRWSQKEFGRFMPIHPASGCRVRAVYTEHDGRTLYAALLPVSGVVNLVFFEKNEQGDFSEPVTVNLDCPPDATPVFCKNENKLFLVWQEKGGIMSSCSIDAGRKWSKPIRYVKGASLEPVLYNIWEKDAWHHAYGHNTEREVSLYAAPPLQDDIKPPAGFRHAGADAEDFARQMGVMVEENRTSSAPTDTITDFFKTELSALKAQFFALRLEVQELKEAIELIKKDCG